MLLQLSQTLSQTLRRILFSRASRPRVLSVIVMMQRRLARGCSELLYESQKQFQAFKVEAAWDLYGNFLLEVRMMQHMATTCKNRILSDSHLLCHTLGMHQRSLPSLVELVTSLVGWLAPAGAMTLDALRWMRAGCCEPHRCPTIASPLHRHRECHQRL